MGLTCVEARERMLEADLGELEGTRDSELSMHVRGCAHCRTVAERIIGVEGELERALTEAAPRSGTAVAVAEAGGRSRRRRWMWRAAPLAAAAALAALLVGPWRAAPVSPSTALDRSRPPSPPDVEVQAPPGRSVAVFKTDNPDIVVVWFF